MKNLTWKRFLSLMLVASMSMTVVGCGNDAEKSSTESSVKEESKQEESKQEESKEEEVIPEEPVTIKLMVMDLESNGLHNYDLLNQDVPVVNELKKDLEAIGINLELEGIGGGEFKNVISTRLAAGVEIPDMVSYVWVGGTDSDDVNSWGESGQLWDFNELLEQYDTDGTIKKIYDENVAGLWEANTTEEGANYFVSHLTSSNATRNYISNMDIELDSWGPYAIQIRSDWVEMVGEEFKDVYSPEELRDLLRKIQQEDANGNGKADEILHVDLAGGYNGIATAYGLARNMIGYYDDDQVFCNLFHENYPEYIEYMKSLYEEGIIDTASVTTAIEQMVAENRAAAVYQSAYYDFEQYLPGEKSKEGTIYRPVMIDLDSDLTNGFNARVSGLVGSLIGNFFVTKACEHPEAIVRLLEYCYSDKFCMLMRFGVEGLGYEMGENGIPLKLTNEADPDQSKRIHDYANLFYFLPHNYNIKGSMELPNGTGKEYEYMAAKQMWSYVDFCTEYVQYMDKYEYVDPKYAAATNAEKETIEALEGVLYTYFRELQLDLIFGKKSLDDLETYKQEMIDLGINDLIAVYQARRDRMASK